MRWTSSSPTPRARCSALLVGVALLVVSLGVAAPEEKAARGDDDVLKLGVVGFYNPRLMYIKYQPLTDYLTEHTPWRWELAISTTYHDTVLELCAGRLALAYLGPVTYVRAHEACGAVPVVRLNTGGSATYQSYIMVDAHNPASSFEDLIGTRVAFGARLSASSHLVPRGMLLDAGLVGGRDYSCVYFDHHDRAARAVLLGDAEACAVRDSIGRKFLRRGLRLLAKTDPIPNFPFVAEPDASEELVRWLREALVDLPARDPEVRSMIETWDEELAGGFVPCVDAEFDSVRTLAKKVFGENALVASEEAISCGLAEAR